MSSNSVETGPKRRRKIWSCRECRRRKLQCDRALPACTRCTQLGHSERCIYVDDAGPQQMQQGQFYGRFSHAPVPSKTTLPKLQQASTLQRLVSPSPAMLHTPNNSVDLRNLESSKDPIHAMDPSLIINNKEKLKLNGNSFKTRFNGRTHAGSMVQYIPGLLEFGQEAIQKHPSLASIREVKRHADVIDPRISAAATLPVARSLILLLPSQAESNRLITTYMDGFDHVYNILDLHEFEQEYHKLWTDMSNVDESFLVLVLLLLAISLCSKPLSRHATTEDAGRAAALVCACEKWQFNQSRAYETIRDYQISFFLLLAKQLTRRRYKQTFANASKVIADFMCAGLHLNECDTGVSISESQRDLRRMLWLSIAEFQLQAAFEQGMPPTLWTRQAIITSPSHPSEISTPSVPPATEYKKSSFLEIASQSLTIRHTLCLELNNLSASFTFSETKSMTETLQTHLETIPEWEGDPKSQASRALLRLNLYQYILALHDCSLRTAKSPFERFVSQMTILDTAMKMIQIHQNLLFQRIGIVDVLCEDVIRASLSMCFAYTTYSSQSTHAFDISQAPLALNTAATLLKQKTIAYGFDHRLLWITIAANAFVKSTEDSSRKDEETRAAVEDFTEMVGPPKPVDKMTQQIHTEEDAIDSSDLGTFWGLPNPVGWNDEDWFLFTNELPDELLPGY